MSRCKPAISLLFIAVAITPALAQADDPIGDVGYHPWLHKPKVKTLDLKHERLTKGHLQTAVEQPDFHNLDAFKLEDGEHPQPDLALRGKSPEGWEQRGSVVLPSEVASGELEVQPSAIHAVEDIPGNEYPRKHKLFLNFGGGMLFSGADNSAIDKSNLAKQAVYPAYAHGESQALAVVQAVANDVAAYGIEVIYDSRPRKLVPYTMQMIGGSWTDTNIDSAACGVAPGADCGALGQRHVVFTFCTGSATGTANTASQEAGHAWGLDHTFNCGSVMSYCGGGDGNFSGTCDGLCESQCQGPNSAGCRLTHEDFCGEGNDQQNEVQELTWIFGGNEPDVEPPFVEIVEPAEDITIEEGEDVEFRALVGDNYGGYGWQFLITKDDEVIFDEPDYDRDVDEEFRPALNLVNLEPGTYVVTIEVEDQFEMTDIDSVTIVVEPSAGSGSGDSADSGEEDGGSGEEDDGSGGFDDDNGDDESGGGTGGLDGGDEGGATDRGCGCQTHGSGSGYLALLGLGFAGFVRRRRLR